VVLNGTDQPVFGPPVRRIRADGNGGDDRIVNRSGLRSTLTGGGGNDTLVGGGGPDTLDGGAKVNHLDGGLGSNQLISSNSGADDPIDVVSYASRAGPIDADGSVLNNNESNSASTLVKLDGGEADTLQGGHWNIIGTGFDDHFKISDNGNVFLVFCGDGDDTVEGDSNGGINNTTIYGENGNDSFSDPSFDGGALFPDGGLGDDTFVSPGFEWDGGEGIDEAIIETTQLQTIDMGMWSGVENVSGVPLGVLTVIGNDLDNQIHLADFFNEAITISGGPGDDTIFGGDSDDSISGDEGNDVIRGGDGNDTLAGGGGRDKLYGQGGDDLLEGRRGSKDTLDGGDGFDTASRDNGPSVFDVVRDIESFIP
jgi:Ca2+-binding RTX toxin-like protein